MHVRAVRERSGTRHGEVRRRGSVQVADEVEAVELNINIYIFIHMNIYTYIHI